MQYFMDLSPKNEDIEDADLALEFYWNHVTTSYQVGCMDQTWNIFDSKEYNMPKKEPSNKTPILECSKVKTSVKDNWSYLLWPATA